MNAARFIRFTAVAGLIGVVLYAVSAGLIFDLPDINAPAAVWSAYAASHSAQLLGEVYVWGAVVAAMACFTTGLWAYLGQADQPVSEVIATLGLASGFIIWAIVLAGLAPTLILGYRGGSLDSATVATLRDATLLGVTLSGFPTMVSVGAFSALILRTGAIARWIGWFGFVVVLAHLVAAGSFGRDGLLSPSLIPVFVAPPLFFLWTLAVSIAMLGRARAAQSAPTAEIASAARGA